MKHFSLSSGIYLLEEWAWRAEGKEPCVVPALGSQVKDFSSHVAAEAYLWETVKLWIQFFNFGGMPNMPNECSFSSLQMKAMLAQDKAAFSAPQCLRHLHLKVRQVMKATWPSAYAWWDAEAHDKEAGQQFNHLPSWWWRGMEAISQKQGRQLAELILLLFSPVSSGPAPGETVQETRG